MYCFLFQTSRRASPVRSPFDTPSGGWASRRLPTQLRHVPPSSRGTSVPPPAYLGTTATTTATTATGMSTGCPEWMSKQGYPWSKQTIYRFLGLSDSPTHQKKFKSILDVLRSLIDLFSTVLLFIEYSFIWTFIVLMIQFESGIVLMI